MRPRSGRPIPFPVRQRRLVPFAPRGRHRPAGRRRRGSFPFAAPILVLAGGLAVWLAISPHAPAAWTGFWTDLARAIGTAVATDAGSDPASDPPAATTAAPAAPEPALASAGDPALTGRATVIDADT